MADLAAQANIALTPECSIFKEFKTPFKNFARVPLKPLVHLVERIFARDGRKLAGQTTDSIPDPVRFVCA